MVNCDGKQGKQRKYSFNSLAAEINNQQVCDKFAMIMILGLGMARLPPPPTVDCVVSLGDALG